FLWILGFLAVLSFNARMAILVNVLALVIYVCRLQFTNNLKLSNKLVINAIILFSIAVIGYLMFYQGFGDRLFKSELLDESSAQTRLDLFAVFENTDLGTFLNGIPKKDFDYLMDQAGLLIIENYWVCMIILYGIFFMLFYLVLYFRLLGNYLKS